MDIEIVDKKINSLLDRVEIRFKAQHPGIATPKRDEVREAVASLEDVKKNNVVLEYLKSEFGKGTTVGYARVYKDVEQARAIEPEHILKRNNLYVAKKKKDAEEE